MHLDLIDRITAALTDLDAKITEALAPPVNGGSRSALQHPRVVDNRC